LHNFVALTRNKDIVTSGYNPLSTIALHVMHTERRHLRQCDCANKLLQNVQHVSDALLFRWEFVRGLRQISDTLNFKELGTLRCHLTCRTSSNHFHANVLSKGKEPVV